MNKLLIIWEGLKMLDKNDLHRKEIFNLLSLNSLKYGSSILKQLDILDDFQTVLLSIENPDKPLNSSSNELKHPIDFKLDFSNQEERERLQYILNCKTEGVWDPIVDER